MAGYEGADSALIEALGAPSVLVSQLRTDGDYAVWPENGPIVEVFQAMQTQWRIGMAGATGLDYAALPVVLRMQGIAPADRAEVFHGVRQMEAAVLAVLAEKAGR